MSLVGPGGADQYLYWGTPAMGWRDGLQSHFGAGGGKPEPMHLPDGTLVN